MRQILLKKSFFIFLIILFFSVEGFAQTIGDYRSAVTGNWTTLSSWERWNGSSWVVPTSGQGYPGQYTGTGAVTIRDSHDITISISTPNNFTSLTVGEGISGTLIVFNDLSILTTSIVINPNAIITFEKNKEVHFPANTSLVINAPGKLDTDTYCSNNNAVYIGDVKFATCVGSGNSEFTFTQLNNNGGTIRSNPSSNSPVCFGSTINLIGGYTGSAGKTTSNGSTSGVTYSWSKVSGPSATILNNSSQNASIVNASAGTYEIKLVCTTYFGNNVFTDSKIITVIVNVLPTQPTLSTVTQPTCSVTTGSFTVTNYSGSYTYTVSPSAGVSFSAGTITAPAGTYTVTATLGSCSSVASASVTVNTQPVTPAQPTLSAVTQPTCSVSTGSFTVTNYSGSYSYTVSPSTGVNFSAGTITAPVGTYTVTATSGSCSSVASVSVTVNAQPTVPVTPTAGTPTNPTCKVPTGSVVLSNLPSSGTIVQTGERTDNIAITTGGSQSIIGLLPGTYYFAVSNGSCTSATVNVVIANPENNTWSSGSWSNGTPTINQRLIFASDYTNANDVDLVGCSCQVSGSATVTIKSGRTLKIENGVEVQPNAKLIFENNASLVQINDAAVNTGNINYKRHTAAVKRYDFTYWSSPVVGQTLKALSPNTLYDKYYSYNPNTGWKIEYNGGATMAKGNGYIIRAPQTFSITVASVDTNPTFIGEPNNGLVSLELGGNKTHLIGNPYPSAIDADAFLKANTKSDDGDDTNDNDVLEGTLYFWTHNSAPSSAVDGDATYNYTTNDYATYNRTGGVSTTKTAVTGGVSPTGKIAAGQGFFAPASATGGTLVFNNAMRLSGGASGTNNSQFFKLATASKTTTTTAAPSVEKSRVWLDLTNSQGAFKQTLVGYISGATNAYEGGFDGVTYDGNSFVDFYSVNQGVNLSIQGRALPFEKKDSVALGYKAKIKGEFKISINHLDGNLATQNIFLEDKDLKVLHDLKKEPYAFNTETGTFNNRFVLRYVDKNAPEEVIKPEVPEVSNKEVLVLVQDKAIKVKSLDVALEKVIVYHVTGGKIYQKDSIDANLLLIEHLNSSHQLLIVEVFLTDGTKISRKVIY